MTKQDLMVFLDKVNDSAEIRIVEGDNDVPLEQVTLRAIIEHPDMKEDSDPETWDPAKWKQGPTHVVLGKTKVC